MASALFSTIEKFHTRGQRRRTQKETNERPLASRFAPSLSLEIVSARDETGVARTRVAKYPPGDAGAWQDVPNSSSNILVADDCLAHSADPGATTHRRPIDGYNLASAAAQSTATTATCV